MIFADFCRLFSNIEALEEITKGRLKNSTAEQLETSVQTGLYKFKGNKQARQKGLLLCGLCNK